MANLTAARSAALARARSALVILLAFAVGACLVGEVGGGRARDEASWTGIAGAPTTTAGVGTGGGQTNAAGTGASSGGSLGGGVGLGVSGTAGAAMAPPDISGFPMTLRGLAEALGNGADGRPRIEIGVASDKPMDDGAFGAIVAREFNLLGGSNYLKQQEWAADKWDWKGDRLIEWGQSHAMALRGHVLIYPAYLPDWWKHAGYTAAQNLERMQNTVQAMLGHFQGKVPRYDVINEVLEYNAGAYASNVLKDTIGAPEYVDQAFRFAHQADPSVMLFYNENNSDAKCEDSSFGRCGKADFLYDLVKGMLGRGVPIHGVGLQMHLTLNDYYNRGYPSKDGLVAQFQRFEQLGLEVNVTEFDIVGPKDGQNNDKDFDAQKVLGKRVVEACLAVAACRVVMFWDGTDRDTWYNSLGDAYKGALPCPLDRALQPKPFYFGVREALTEAVLSSRGQQP